jgi:hypothetical protein
MIGICLIISAITVTVSVIVILPVLRNTEITTNCQNALTLRCLNIGKF